MRHHLRLLLPLLVLLPLHVLAGDIIVRPGDNLHDALRQAREWRRTGDSRCQDGIHIIVAEEEYVSMEECGYFGKE